MNNIQATTALVKMFRQHPELEAKPIAELIAEGRAKLKASLEGRV